MPQRRGKRIDDGEFATLIFERVYPHTTGHVWEAISTPEGLRGWLMCSHAEIEGRVGGRFNMVSGPAQYVSTGTILEWAPPRVLEYEWNVEPVSEMPMGERAIFRYELTPVGQSTHLRVTYRRVTKRTAGGFLPGLHAFLDRLEAQLDERDLPNWMDRFVVLRGEYPEWSGHASDSRK